MCGRERGESAFAEDSILADGVCNWVGAEWGDGVSVGDGVAVGGAGDGWVGVDEWFGGEWVAASGGGGAG